ncbi:hypothetical protein BC834DRAFT_853719 [Gloeopeniophorella convolvens]|nr:hypothetical protein BC834DRAFT_853719 [Gloeopeniophorella convolvens]
MHARLSFFPLLLYPFVRQPSTFAPGACLAYHANRHIMRRASCHARICACDCARGSRLPPMAGVCTGDDGRRSIGLVVDICETIDAMTSPTRRCTNTTQALLDVRGS